MTLLNKKRIKLVLGSIALVAICAVVFYFRAYPIKLNMVTLDWQTIGELRGEDESLTVLGTGMSIDRKEFYLISVDGQFGYVSFERGPFGRHRLRNVGYGDGDFRNGIIRERSVKIENGKVTNNFQFRNLLFSHHHASVASSCPPECPCSSC